METPEKMYRTNKTKKVGKIGVNYADLIRSITILLDEETAATAV